MKINNETKVGILAVVAILVLVFGFNFLKGKQIFKKRTSLFAVFKNLGSLEKSNAVKINGLAIGTVYDFAPTNREVDSIIVEIRLDRDVGRGHQRQRRIGHQARPWSLEWVGTG